MGSPHSEQASRDERASGLPDLPGFSTILGNILFLTSVWQYSILQAGLTTAPGPFLSAVAAAPSSRAPRASCCAPQ